MPRCVRTPLSLKEKIPWKCHRACDRHWCGALPVMDQVKQEARHREIKLFIVPTARAIDLLRHQPADINAVLHITC